jgi:hypothetical protein
VNNAEDVDTSADGVAADVAKIEVGADGQLGSYDAAAIGGFPDPQQRSSQGKVFLNLADGTDSAVSDRVQVRLIGTKKTRNSRTPLTPWITVRGEDASDPAQRTALRFDGVEAADFVTDGSLIILEARLPGGTVNVDINSGSTNVELPVVAGAD